VLVCHLGPCTPKSEIWPPNLNYCCITGLNAPESVSLDNVAASVEGGAETMLQICKEPLPLSIVL
jgi:hypothetical protein